MQPANQIDSFIATVLALNGQVRPLDMTTFAEDEREPALRGYFERHAHERPLHFEGEALVEGDAPVPETPPEPGPVPEAAPETAPEPSVTARAAALEAADVDLLLGDFDGVTGAAATEAPPLPEHEPLATGLSAASSRPGASGPGFGAPGGSRPIKPVVKRPPFRWRLWMIWWLPTLLVPALGGIAAWFVLRHKHEQTARVMLGFGLALGMIGSVLFVRYARSIAGFATGASRDTTIVLPAKQATQTPQGQGSSSSGGGSGAY